MSTAIRNEFMGSWLRFTAMCVTVFLIPMAVLYLVSGLLRIDTQTGDPETLVAKLRSERIDHGMW